MASKNQLLGHGGVEEKVHPSQREQIHAPAWRYHDDYPEGKVVKTDIELERLDKEGWVDHPKKVKKKKKVEKVDTSLQDIIATQEKLLEDYRKEIEELKAQLVSKEEKKPVSSLLSKPEEMSKIDLSDKKAKK